MLKRWWTPAAATVVLAGVVAITGSNEPAPPPDDAMILVGRAGSPLFFRLDGKPVESLYPGAVRPMRITVVNPFGFRLSLRRLDGRVARSSRRGCPATSSSLRIRPYTGPLPVSIPPHSRIRLSGSLAVTMPYGASPKCAGAHFSIAVTGVGYRMDR